MILGVGAAQAATITWNSGSSGLVGNFDVAGNWVGGVLPGSADTALIDNGGTTLGATTVTYGASDNFTLTALNLGTSNVGSDMPVFNQTGGTLSVGTLNLAAQNGASKSPQYNLSGGTLNVSASFVWGNGSNIRFIESAGTVNFTGTNGFTMGTNNGANAFLTISGGAFNANSTTAIAMASVGSGNATIALSNGGSFSANAVTSFNLGGGGTGTGTITMANNSTFSVNAAPTIFMGNGGTGVLTLNDSAQFSATSAILVLGQFGATSTATVTMSGSSLLTAANVKLGGNNGTSASYGVFNLNGGTLATGSVRLGASTTVPDATHNAFIGNGGTVRALASGNNSDFFAGAFVNLKFGGLTFDTNSNAVTITNNITDAPANSGGLTKITNGTLTLSGFSTYSGGTTVNGGTLALASGGGNGAIVGNLTVNSGAMVSLNAANAFGFNTGVKVSTVNINGGTLSATVAGDQGWGVTYNLTGGVMQSNGGVSDTTAGSLFAFGGPAGGNTAVNTLASATTSVISGRVNLRPDNGNATVNFNVADGGVGGVDLLVSAGITSVDAGNAPASVGITKLGAGTMNLTGANTYSGLTLISAGKFLVNGSVAGAVTVDGLTSVLGGGGSISGAVTAQNGATVWPSASPGNAAVTLSTGTLGSDASTVFKFELGAPGIVGAGFSDLLNVTGDLSLAGTLQVFPGAGFGDGVYTLATYTGSLTNNSLTLDPAFLAANPGSFIDTSTPNQVNLDVVPEPGAFASLIGGAALFLGFGRRRKLS